MPTLAKNYTVIAPDLRGFGDSSKPVTGYDGNTTAEDIYQLLSQQGFSSILLVVHGVGSQTTYSYSADHPENVSKLVLMDSPFLGFSLQNLVRIDHGGGLPFNKYLAYPKT
jgi:pimeloyl-ACP methyl ester carboxylesterase